MSEQIEANISAPTQTSTLWLGATSAFRALALIAVFDREYRFAPWLHWIVVNWNAFLADAFSFLRLDIAPEQRTLFAFGMIMLGTIIAERVLSISQGRIKENLGLTFGTIIFVLLGFDLLLASASYDPFLPISGLIAWQLFFFTALLLFFAFLLAKRTLLWLLAFVVIFVGLNELALAVGGTIPAPPSS
jgi:hypothetical protein